MSGGNFRGKRLFAGRLFAGRLFGPPSDVGMPPMSRRRVSMAGRVRGIDDEDALLLLAAALCAGAGLLEP
jgi:hypothetical protein